MGKVVVSRRSPRNCSMYRNLPRYRKVVLNSNENSTGAGNTANRQIAISPNPPYTFPASVMATPFANMWQGHRCFIIASGPSAANFPIDDLTNELIITVNRSFTLVSNPSVIYAMDRRFVKFIKTGALDLYDKQPVRGLFESLPCPKILLQSASQTDYPYITLCKKQRARTFSKSFESGIYGGNNSGFGALMLAILFGADPIYLIGYDMNVHDSPDGKQVWHHNGYPINRQSASVYKKFILEFERMADEINKRAHVYNLNPNSGLTCFDHADWRDIGWIRDARELYCVPIRSNPGKKNVPAMLRLVSSASMFGMKSDTSVYDDNMSLSDARSLLPSIYPNRDILFIRDDMEVTSYFSIPNNNGDHIVFNSQIDNNDQDNSIPICMYMNGGIGNGKQTVIKTEKPNFLSCQQRM